MGILQRLSLVYAYLLIIHRVTNYGERNKRIIGFITTVILGVTYTILMLKFQSEK